MKCPIDETTLTISDRQGVEIDFCPQCRGVWLDRGELDKIIERDATAVQPRQADRTSERNDDRYQERFRHDDDDRRYSDNYQRRPKKRESFLGDLFDF